MGKRKYRSTALEKVDWSAVCEKADDSRVVFAVDVAKEDFMGQLVTGERRVLETVRWKHPQQSRALLQALRDWFSGVALEAVMEPTGTYGDAFRGLLEAEGVPVYRMSPKRVHDAAELYDGVPSMHDAKSAYLIGRLHLEGVSQRWEGHNVQRRQMKALQGQLSVYKGRLQRGLNRLEAQLARHWPELPGLLALDSATVLHLVADYGDPGRVVANRAGAEALMRRVGGNTLTAEKRRQVLSSASDSVGLACIEAERALLRELAEDLLRTRKRLKELERQIKAEVKQTAELRNMAAVVGHTTSAVLMATQGSPLAYPDARSYQKSLGLNLKERSSGKHKGQLKLTKRGPSLGRRYAYFATLRLINSDPVVSRWVKAKAERDGGAKSKAVTAVMRKLAKALWHVARGEPFDSSKLFNVPSASAAA